MVELTSAELIAKVDNIGLVGIGWTRLLGAVTDTEAEVLIAAKTSDIVWLTAKGLSLAQHASDTEFLRTLSAVARAKDQ